MIEKKSFSAQNKLSNADSWSGWEQLVSSLLFYFISMFSSDLFLYGLCKEVEKLVKKIVKTKDSTLTMNLSHSTVSLATNDKKLFLFLVCIMTVFDSTFHVQVY